MNLIKNCYKGTENKTTLTTDTMQKLYILGETGFQKNN
jgi:hypothetical protein